MREMKWVVLAVVGVFFLTGFLKQKVCQNRETGDLKSVPWYWPCCSSCDAIKSASTE